MSQEQSIILEKFRTRNLLSWENQINRKPVLLQSARKTVVVKIAAVQGKAHRL